MDVNRDAVVSLDEWVRGLATFPSALAADAGEDDEDDGLFVRVETALRAYPGLEAQASRV